MKIVTKFEKHVDGKCVSSNIRHITKTLCRILEDYPKDSNRSMRVEDLSGHESYFSVYIPLKDDPDFVNYKGPWREDLVKGQWLIVSEESQGYGCSHTLQLVSNDYIESRVVNTEV